MSPTGRPPRAQNRLSDYDLIARRNIDRLPRSAHDLGTREGGSPPPRISLPRNATGAEHPETRQQKKPNLEIVADPPRHRWRTIWPVTDGQAVAGRLGTICSARFRASTQTSILPGFTVGVALTPGSARAVES